MRAGWLIALLLIAATPLRAQLSEFESSEGRFAIMMPTDPRPMIQEIPTADSSLVITIHMFASLFDEATYGVGYGDYPASFGKFLGKQILHNVLASLTRNKKIIWQKEVVLDGYPGFAVRADDQSAGFVMEVWAYMVGDRLYQIMVVGDRSKVDIPYREEFLASFRLIK